MKKKSQITHKDDQNVGLQIFLVVDIFLFPRKNLFSNFRLGWVTLRQSHQNAPALNPEKHNKF